MEESPREFVHRVREQTCYGSLRAVLRACAVLGYVGGILMIGAALRGLSRASGLDAGPTAAQGALFVALGGVVLIILTTAAYQASVVVIDMTDTLIEQARPKDPPTPGQTTPKASAPYRIPGL